MAESKTPIPAEVQRAMNEGVRQRYAVSVTEMKGKKATK